MLELTSVHHHFLCSFRMVKKNLFVILEGIAVVGLMKSDVFILSLEKVWHCLQQLIVRICTHVTKRSVLISRTSRIHPCPSSPNKTYRICTLGDSRLNCLKTIPFTAADTYIAHIWQYPPPPLSVSCFHPYAALRS